MADVERSGPSSTIPYTTFTQKQKRVLTCVLTLTMLASPLTATIYLPLLPLLAQQYHVSMQEINLTITLYVVFQAISPLIFATASDVLGRRPIYLATYALYTVASLGLALVKSSYVGLLVLRSLQSLGASAVLAIAFGVVADVCPPAERGAMLGPTQSAANLAVCLGPILGGLVALNTSGVVWIFWSLTIFGGVVFVLVGLFLPETAREVVGNGQRNVSAIFKTWLSLVKDVLGKGDGRSQIADASEKPPNGATREARERKRKGGGLSIIKFKPANPWAACRILFWKDTSLTLWLAASPYAVWYIVQASIPGIYKETYKLNELQIGLAYLPGGIAVVLGGYANGKLMDWKYRKTAEDIGYTIDRVSGDDLSNFPIERARGRGSWYLLAVYIVALAGYGWSVVARVQMSVPLVIQFVLATLCTCFQQTFNTLLVDVFPSSPSTAAASSNITRCVLSALGVAVLQPLVSFMGRGWLFTLLSAISGGGGLIASWLLQNKGMLWRQQRLSAR